MKWTAKPKVTGERPASTLARFGAAAFATRYADGEGWWVATVLATSTPCLQLSAKECPLGMWIKIRKKEFT